jgi:arylformamidase
MKTSAGFTRMKLNRRMLLNTAAAGIAAGGKVFGQQSVPSQQTSRAKGPLVWLDMDQKELDDAYTQAAYAPNQRQITNRYAANSDLTRQRIGPPRRFAYGPTPIEGLDVYPTTRRTNAPILVYVHGGAWRNGLAKHYAFPAEVFTRAGAHYVALDFINVDDAGGSLEPMADQVRRAVAWVYRNAASFGGDSNRLYLAGHSSGAHLAGVVLVTDWQNEFKLPPDVVKAALCCSGIYDLEPVRLSVRSSYVKFTDESEQALSPQRHLAKLACPVTLAFGTLETPEFQRQTRDFASALKAAGKPEQLLVGDGYNHFEIMETLGNPYGLLGRAALELMNLAPV